MTSSDRNVRTVSVRIRSGCHRLTRKNGPSNRAESAASTVRFPPEDRKSLTAIPICTDPCAHWPAESVVANSQLCGQCRQPRVRCPQLKASNKGGGEEVRIDPANTAPVQSSIAHSPPEKHLGDCACDGASVTAQWSRDVSWLDLSAEP